MTSEAAGGSRATWRRCQALVTQARDDGALPLLRALAERGANLCWLSFWGMEFTPEAVSALKADSEFNIAIDRGEVGMLAEVKDSAARVTASPWIVALASAGPPPIWLPPFVAEVWVPLQLGGSARYIFTRPIYALSARSAEPA